MYSETLFGLAAAAVLTLAGCASTSGTTPSAAVADQNFDCRPSTATRMPVSPNCAAVVRSYSSEEISRTGAPSPQQALPLLDPSVTIHHY